MISASVANYSILYVRCARGGFSQSVGQIVLALSLPLLLTTPPLPPPLGRLSFSLGGGELEITISATRCLTRALPGSVRKANGFDIFLTRPLIRAPSMDYSLARGLLSRDRRRSVSVR